MKSAGNDIVALNSIDKQRTCHPAFYSKFITVTEQGLHTQPGLPFENFVWLLWSVKEAAYKFLKRHDTALIFSPSKIVVQYIKPSGTFENDLWEGDQVIDTFYTGSVSYQSTILYFRSKINQQYITTVVDDEEGFSDVYWSACFINDTGSANQSEKIRAFVLDKLNSLLPHHQITIKKSTVGYPVLFNSDKVMDIPLSFAHHDHYIAYSFKLAAN